MSLNLIIRPLLVCMCSYCAFNFFELQSQSCSVSHSEMINWFSHCVCLPGLQHISSTGSEQQWQVAKADSSAALGRQQNNPGHRLPTWTWEESEAARSKHVLGSLINVSTLKAFARLRHTRPLTAPELGFGDSLKATRAEHMFRVEESTVVAAPWLRF